MPATFTLTTSQPGTIDFRALGILVSNPTGRWIYIRLGGNDLPTQVSADIRVAPYTYYSDTISPASLFGFTLGDIVSPSATQAGDPTVSLSETGLPTAIANINLPGVVYRPTLLTSYAILMASNVSRVLVTPAVTQSILVYQLRATLYHAASAPQHIVFWAGTVYADSLVIADAWIATSYPNEQISFLPYGAQLAHGAPLQVFQENVPFTALAPTISVIYSRV